MSHIGGSSPWLLPPGDERLTHLEVLPEMTSSDLGEVVVLAPAPTRRRGRLWTGGLARAAGVVADFSDRCYRYLEEPTSWL